MHKNLPHLLVLPGVFTSLIVRKGVGPTSTYTMALYGTNALVTLGGTPRLSLNGARTSPERSTTVMFHFCHVNRVF
jgi:hypothetical protein